MKRCIVLLILCASCKTVERKTPPEVKNRETLANYEILSAEEKKLDGKALRTTDLVIDTLEEKGNQFPVIRYTADSQADFVEYQACRQGGTCRDGTSSLAAALLPGLASGLYRMRVRSCLNPNHTLKLTEEACGPYTETYYLQKENQDKKLDALLAKKVKLEQDVVALGKVIFDSASKILENLPNCNDKTITSKIPRKKLKGFVELGPDLIGLGLLEPDAAIELSASGGDTRIVVETGSPSDTKNLSRSITIGAAAILAPILLRKFGTAVSSRVGGMGQAISPWKRNVLIGLGSAAIVGLVGYAIYSMNLDPASLTAAFFQDMFLTADHPCPTIKEHADKILQAFLDAKELRSGIDGLNNKINSLP
ncbi:MAG: hypothetical protein HYW48_11525 [Deltaproteobacteria bacterium]|nr:hypothetical protein [Deltaproteobacteria bacterium]